MEMSIHNMIKEECYLINIFHPKSISYSLMEEVISAIKSNKTQVHMTANKQKDIEKLEAMTFEIIEVEPDAEGAGDFKTKKKTKGFIFSSIIFNRNPEEDFYCNLTIEPAIALEYNEHMLKDE